jgi:hypothetical protein
MAGLFFSVCGWSASPSRGAIWPPPHTKALVTAELMITLHLSMAYYKGSHLLQRQNGGSGTEKAHLLPKTLI